ncbi:MAG: SH3 domain-containing protein [Anaerolineae bacterium]
MTRRQWSLAIVLILVNYLIFSALFNQIFTIDFGANLATRTPEPTWTPSPSATPLPQVLAASTSESDERSPEPTATSTRVLQAPGATEPPAQGTASSPGSGEGQPPPTGTPAPDNPNVTASDGNVNIRNGPGTNYQRIGSLRQGQSAPVVGRNADASWWQIATAAGQGWVADSVVTAANTGGVPEVETPPPPPPTNTPPPPPPTETPPPPQPQFQYTVANAFEQLNEAITQIRGNITDAAGNNIDGVRVRVRSGTFCTVSYPSGAPGNYPPGNYDILLDTFAKPGTWTVDIVDGPANPGDTQCNPNLKTLSEEITVNTEPPNGVIFIEWRKNF